MTESETKRPSVLIVGAGLGGLTLGAILERTNIDYQIYERSPEVNPIGSAIALSASVMPMFKQLGLFDKLNSISKLNAVNHIYSEQLDLHGTLDYLADAEERYHYPRLMTSRPKLYDLLLEQIPQGKIHYSKKVLSHQETGTGVILRFSDNSSVEGNILVGADGANSAVRQVLYKRLEKTDELPPSDKLPLKYSSISLVGQTRPLDPEKYTILQGNCDPEIILSDTKGLLVVAFPTAQNTICWMVVEFLDKETSKIHDNFRTSEWGPEAAEAMAKDEAIRKVVVPGAAMSTMGELIDMTPKELLSKVMLEEKLFKTWSLNRTVLLGDACHKMSPSAGQGAVNAMLDAVILANYIESLKTNSLKNMAAAFKAYKNERYGGAKAAVDGSAALMLIAHKGFLGSVVRKIMLDPPKWLWNLVSSKTEGYRPQIAFLPQVEDKGTVKTPYQPSLHLPTTTRPKSGSVVV